MQFGYVILYVDDVEATIAFYEKAFGLKGKMVMPGEFGELETGTTKLSFAARKLVTTLFATKLNETGLDKPAAPMEVGLVTTDVQKAFDTAVAAGAVAAAKPEQKPWGQTIAYVRDNNGFLVELCTAME
jgi:lactoylglutathione lyase